MKTNGYGIFLRGLMMILKTMMRWVNLTVKVMKKISGVRLNAKSSDSTSMLKIRQNKIRIKIMMKVLKKIKTATHHRIQKISEIYLTGLRDLNSCKRREKIQHIKFFTMISKEQYNLTNRLTIAMV